MDNQQTGFLSPKNQRRFEGMKVDSSLEGSLMSSRGESPSDSIYLSGSSLEDPPIHPHSTYLPHSNSDSNLMTDSMTISSPQTNTSTLVHRGENLPVHSSWNHDSYLESPRSPIIVEKSSDSYSSNGSNNLADSKVFTSIYLSTPGQTAKPHYLNSPTQTIHHNNTNNNTNTFDHRPESFTANPPQYYATPYEEESPSMEAFVVTQRPTSTGISPMILAAAAYFFGWLGGLVVVLLEKKNRFVLVHAYQSLICGILAFFIQLFFVWSKFLYGLLWFVYLGFTIAMIVRVVLDNSTLQIYKLPYIGEWCDHRALNRIQRYTANPNFYNRL